jgi:hypothetical protein
MPAAYPEFSQFKELPAWGLYVRHAKNLTLENITFTAKLKEYRPALVFDDVLGGRLTGLRYEEPVKKKKQVHFYKTKDIIQTK